MTKRRPLTDFLGIFKGKKGEEFEKTVMNMREKRTKLHQTRMARIVKELRGP
jgi:predicted CopG family antitoxin